MFNQRICSIWLTLHLIIFMAACGSDNLPASTGTPVQPTAISSSESQIRARIPLPMGAWAVAVGDGSIWVTDNVEQHVLRLDMRTGKAAGSPIPLAIEPREIAYGEGAVWVGSADRSRLIRIDPETNEIVAEIDLGALQIPSYNLVLIASGEGAVWITDQTRVIQIDPETNQLIGEPLQAGEEIIAAALGHGTLWTGSHDDGIISRIDAKTHRVVASINMGFAIHGLAVSEDSAWVLDEHGFAVVRIDPKSNQVQERILIDFVGANLAAGARSVWVAPAARDNGQATGNDGIARISESQRQVVEVVHVGGMPASEYYAAYLGERYLWVFVDTPQSSLVQIVPSP